MLALFLPEFHEALAELDSIASRITIDLHKLAMVWKSRSRPDAKGRRVGNPTQRPLRP